MKSKSKLKSGLCLLSLVLCPAVITASTGQAKAVEKALPDENGGRAAISPAPFPDRMSAYVWRNWGLVDKTTLAKTVNASVGDITTIATEMGLEAEPTILPEWKTKGYITIIRRNWQLLDYDQLMMLIGKNRAELYFSLMEDDFLWVKLGCVKPKCGPLDWQAITPKEKQLAAKGRMKIAQILEEEGLNPNAYEEPRFSFVNGIAECDPNFKLPGKDASPFDFRVIFSYFADYGDPLADPEIGSFPEGLLQKLANNGVNAVWMHTVLRTLAKDPKYPEFGEGSEKRIANLKKLVARCDKYGIKVYLYLNEPRAMPKEFFEVNAERKEIRGTCLNGPDGEVTPDTTGLQYAMCTSHPETRRWLRDSVAQVFSQVQGLGGIFTITMSENLTSCVSRWGHRGCARCKDRNIGEVVAEVNNAMIEGMLKGDKNAQALLYNWAWPKDVEELIIKNLAHKESCRVLAVSEHAMKINRGGVEAEEQDYSISIVGPGEESLKTWQFCKAAGVRGAAKVQAGNSWEISSFPYIPTMDLVARHAVNLANAGVDGVMLSWSLGCCPSPNLEVYRELKRGEKDENALLNRMAEKLYGKDKAPLARQAWTAFSKGFENYPFSCQTIYNGPHQWGPANPLYKEKTGYKATMVGIPYDDLDGWRAQYPGETYADLMDKVTKGFREGCRLMEGVAKAKELDMFKAESMHFASCRDQAKFVMARDKGDKAGMRAIAQAELRRAKNYWKLVRADSRIGYESSNQYFFVPRDVLEKVLSCRAVIDEN